MSPESLERFGCTIKLLRVDKGKAAFHDLDDYGRLVEVARLIDIRRFSWCCWAVTPGWLRRDPRARMGRRPSAKRQLCVRQSDWNGQLGTPKSGRIRYVPLTQRLTAALVEHRHLRSKRVLCQDRRLTVHAADRAEPDEPGVEAGEGEEGRAYPSSHVLLAPVDARRAGASHSGARGARGLTMTQRYMHLSPAALEAAIRLLDEPRNEGVWASGASDLTLSVCASCRSLETWWRRPLGVKMDEPNNRAAKLAVRQGFEPWIQLLGRITV